MFYALFVHNRSSKIRDCPVDWTKWTMGLVLIHIKYYTKFHLNIL